MNNLSIIMNTIEFNRANKIKYELLSRLTMNELIITIIPISRIKYLFLLTIIASVNEIIIRN